MTLLEQWNQIAYEAHTTEKEANTFWGAYFNIEKEIYQKILASDTMYEDTVENLAKTFDVKILSMVGFLDGINESLIKENDLENMKEDTVVSLAYDKEKLYYNMVGAKADWLYNLEEWEPLLSSERRKELYKEQKISTTIVKDKKIGRNDPCPCNSGKKYKQCCGR